VCFGKNPLILAAVSRFIVFCFCILKGMNFGC